MISFTFPGCIGSVVTCHHTGSWI